MVWSSGYKSSRDSSPSRRTTRSQEEPSASSRHRHQERRHSRSPGSRRRTPSPHQRSRSPQRFRRSRSPRRRSRSLSPCRRSCSPHHRSRLSQPIPRSRSPRPQQEYDGLNREELARRLRRAENRVANAERRAREAEGHRTTAQAEADPRLPSILRPPRASRMPLKEIREALGVSKQGWNNIRTTIRHNAHAARLDYDKDLRNQRSSKFIKLCNASAETHPELNRFENHWGTERLAKEYFRAHKTYKNCVRNANTYRGARASRRHSSPSPAQSPTHPSSHDNDDYLAAMQAAEDALASEPVAGPSRIRRPSPSRVSSSASSEGGGDDDELDLGVLDDEDQEEEEEEQVHGKGKAKAKPKVAKRSRKH